MLLVIGVAALGDLWHRGLPFYDQSGLGPAFFPATLAVALCILGPLLAFARIAEPPVEDGDEHAAGPAPMLKFTALIVALILAFPWLGGLLAFSLFVAFELIFVERSRVIAGIASGVGTFAIVWFVFIWLLAVPLPAGILGIP